MKFVTVVIFLGVTFSCNSFADECKFSMFSTWSDEIAKKQKKIKILSEERQEMVTEMYWAQEDIRKQDVLPSETVRDAYDLVKEIRVIIAEDNARLRVEESCLQCATARKNGAASCNL